MRQCVLVSAVLKRRTWRSFVLKMTSYSTQIDDVRNDEETDHLKQNENLVENDSNINVPDSENENKNIVTVKYDRFQGIILIHTGALIFLISVIVQQATSMKWLAMAGPVYANLTGLHIFFIGIFQFIHPKNRTSYDFIINGKQITGSIQVRNIIRTITNLIFSVVGIIFMSTVGVSWTNEWPVWNKLGLTISLLIALATLLHLLSDHISSKHQDLRLSMTKSSHPSSNGLYKELKNIIINMSAATIALLPELYNAKLEKCLPLSKSLLHKALHHIIIVVSVLLAAAIFSAQLIDIRWSPKNEAHEAMSDPTCTYAINWHPNQGPPFSPYSTKLMVLISAPVTLLLCLPLFFLTHRTSMLNLILAFIISGAMAGFHCFQTVATISWMILMGSSVTPLTFYLRLGIAIGSPILASILLSLALSYLNTLLREEILENEKLSYALIIPADMVTIVTMAALIFNTEGLTMAMQSHWNSSHSGTTDCYNREAQFYKIKDNFLFFSWVQSGLSVTLLTVSFLIVLTGNKISRPILLLIGIISFSSATATLVFYFTGVFNDTNEMSGLILFYIFNCSQIALGLILGLIFSYGGCGIFVTYFSFLLRFVMTVLTFSILLVLILVVDIINLAKFFVNSTSKEKEEPRNETNGNKIQIEA